MTHESMPGVFVLDNAPVEPSAGESLPAERVVGYIAADGAEVLAANYQPKGSITVRDLGLPPDIAGRVRTYVDAYVLSANDPDTNCLAFAHYVTGLTTSMTDDIPRRSERRERIIVRDVDPKNLATGGLYYLLGSGPLKFQHACVGVSPTQSMSKLGNGGLPTRRPLVVMANADLQEVYGGPINQFVEITRNPVPLHKRWLPANNRALQRTWDAPY